MIGSALQPGENLRLVELPESWQRKRLRHISATPISNGLGEAANDSNPDHPRYIRITDIAGPRKLRSDTFCSLSPDVASQSMVNENDILISAVGATYGKAFFAQKLAGEACYAGYLVRVSPGPDTDPSFLAYWTESLDYWAQVNANVIQATIQNFSAMKVKQLNAPVPPLNTQRQIARFLDEKTARIDGLIEKKRTLLDRLAEKRQALITHAVTKGLPDNLSFGREQVKDRATQEEYGHVPIATIAKTVFLSDVSGNWVKASAGKYCDVQLGKMLQNDPSSEHDELKPYLRAINISKNGLDLSHEASMWIRPQDTNRFRLRKNDVLVSEGGDAGRTAIFNVDHEYYIQNSINRLRPNSSGKIVPEFIFYWFTFLKTVGYVDMVCNVATIPHFTAEKVKAAPIALPPLDTQRQIAKFLDEKTCEIDKQRALIEKSCVLLEEYRAALITAAVTGKIASLL